MLDSFTVSLHSPNGRQMPAVRAVQGDCQWPLKNSKNSHWSHQPIMHHVWGIPQSIFRSDNHTASNTANRRPCLISYSGWRHQMETSSALLALCAGKSPVNGEFSTQRPVTWSFDVFFNLRLNKRLSKQSWGWWFETPSCPLWRHCNGLSSIMLPTPSPCYDGSASQCSHMRVS